VKPPLPLGRGGFTKWLKDMYDLRVGKDYVNEDGKVLKLLQT